MTEVEPSDLVPGNRYNLIMYINPDKQSVLYEQDAEYVGLSQNGTSLLFNDDVTMITIRDDTLQFFTFQDLDIGPILKGGKRSSKRRKSRRRRSKKSRRNKKSRRRFY